MLIDGYLRKRRRRGQVEVSVWAAEAVPMGVAGPAVGHAVVEALDQRGIAYHPNAVVTSVDPAARRIVFQSGDVVDYDLLAYVPPHRVPPVVQPGIRSRRGSPTCLPLATSPASLWPLGNRSPRQESSRMRRARWSLASLRTVSPGARVARSSRGKESASSRWGEVSPASPEATSMPNHPPGPGLPRRAPLAPREDRL